jgi:hypothetical protein
VTASLSLDARDGYAAPGGDAFRIDMAPPDDGVIIFVSALLPGSFGHPSIGSDLVVQLRPFGPLAVFAAWRGAGATKPVTNDGR